MTDRMRPHLKKITAEYVRVGACAACGKRARRVRSITGTSLTDMQNRANAWAAETPLFHKKCEGHA